MEQAHSPRPFIPYERDGGNSRSFWRNGTENERYQNAGPVRQAISKSGTATAPSGWRPVNDRQFAGPDFWPAGLCAVPSALNDI
jgi:hypothetical protein